MWTCLRNRTAHNLLVVGVLVNVALWGMADSAALRSEPYKPPAVDSPAALIAAHDCWTGAQDMPSSMAGVIPGHVVVTIEGRPRYGGPRMVDKALSQIFEGVEHDLTVHAFCR